MRIIFVVSFVERLTISYQVCSVSTTSCLVAANLHSYLYNSTSDSDPSTSTSILRGKLPSFPKYTPTKKNKMMPTKPHCLSLLYICGLLVQAGDLHPNPGPVSTSTPDFPCGICSHEVHEHHHAIQCDECDCWYHTSCVQINDTTYEQLKHNSVLWFCSCCGLPNYSRCLFSSN